MAIERNFACFCPVRGLLRTELDCLVEMILVQENQKGCTPVITELGHCLF